MVSPLNSIIANGRAPQNPGTQIGNMLMQGRQQEASLQGQGLQNQLLQQRVDQGNAPPKLSPEQSLGAARYLNGLGKQLLSMDESQWGQTLEANLPQLQQLGYTPEILRGMTREQVQGVVQQTDPLMGQVSATSEGRNRDRLLSDLRSTDDNVRQSAAIELGLEGRASGAAPQVVDIGGVPHMFDKQSRTLKPIEVEGKRITGSTVAKSQAEIKSAVMEASENARRLASEGGEARSNDKALNVYDTAMAGLTQSLSGTETGLAGWLPAVTSDARVAEGAISAMAPVLKQLFRSAGEGSFTDSDQRLLMEMLPTRKDSPEARKAKIENIDAIVRAKLGSNEDPSQQNQGASNILRFDGQGNPIQ